MKVIFKTLSWWCVQVLAGRSVKITCMAFSTFTLDYCVLSIFHFFPPSFNIDLEYHVVQKNSQILCFGAPLNTPTRKSFQKGLCVSVSQKKWSYMFTVIDYWFVFITYLHQLETVAVTER